MYQRAIAGTHDQSSILPGYSDVDYPGIKKTEWKVMGKKLALIIAVKVAVLVVIVVAVILYV